MFGRIMDAFRQSFCDEPLSPEEEALQGIYPGPVEKLRRFLSSGGNANAAVMLRGAGPQDSTIKPRPIAIWASHYNNSEALALLLDAGASPDTFDPNNGLSLLHGAAYVGNLDLARRLLKSGASPDGHNGQGAGSPLFAAATRGNVEIVSLLLEAGADPNLKNRAGISPLEAIGALPNGNTCGTILHRGR